MHDCEACDSPERRSGAEAVGLAVWSIGCGDSWFFRQEKVTLFFDGRCVLACLEPCISRKVDTNCHFFEVS